MQKKKSEQDTKTQTSKPGKEVIKKNSEQQRAEQSKKDDKAKHIEHNFDKDQE